MKKKICFYHNADLDGQCSAAIVRDFDPDVKLFGMNYGDPVPWEAIDKNTVVYMVDFHLQPFSEMIRLKEQSYRLIWIDHHKSALAETTGTEIISCDGLRSSDSAACELTWLYFYPEDTMPLPVRLLGRYDVWDHKDPWVLPFQYGFRLLNTEPDNDDLWNWALKNYTATWIDSVIRDGKTILRYLEKADAELVKHFAFPVMLEETGIRCIALNSLKANSQVFKSIWDPSKYDAMLAFGWAPSAKKWTISLFSDEIDVSMIALRHGGGGHKNAAGFQTDNLPWLRRETT